MFVLRVWHLSVLWILLATSPLKSTAKKKQNSTISMDTDTMDTKKSKPPPEVAYTRIAPPVLGDHAPEFIMRKEGEDVDMFCEGHGTPHPTLTWYKDGHKLFSAGQVRVNGNRVHITSLSRHHGGIYTCTFSNVVGKASHVVKLVIEGNAYIMVPPKNSTVREGQRVKLNCQAEGYPNNITYRWFKDGVDIQLVEGGLMQRAGVFGDGRFVISKVEKSDSGWYKCRPSNGLGPPPEASAYLNVTYLPLVLDMSPVYSLPRGMLAHVPCPTDANPPVTLVVWTKDSHVIDFMRSSRLRLGRNWSLVIKDVSVMDAGMYTCQPYSSLGTGFMSRRFQVLVKDPPHFVLRPRPYYQRQQGQTVTMACRADGEPEAKITWRKANGKLPKENKLYQAGGNLTIVNLHKEDHGIYECVATNVVTSVVTVTKLIIELTTPHAAKNVTLVTGQFWAKISWIPAYNGGYEQHYILWYRMARHTRRNPWQTIRIEPSTVTSFTIYNLFPDTQYEFTLLSRNKLGDGLFSKVVKARTGGYDEDLATALPTRHDGKTYIPPIITPLGPLPFSPSNLTVQYKDQGLDIRWSPPKNLTVPILYYTVEYKTVGPWLRLNGEIQGATSYFWKNPSRGVDYTFRIKAHSRTAFSKPSKSLLVPFKNIDSPKMHLSGAVVGGIVGGLLFLFLAIILALVAVKLFNKRRKHREASRYGNVKYFGPNHTVDGNKKRSEGWALETSETQEIIHGNGRGNFVRKNLWSERIFTLQQPLVDSECTTVRTWTPCSLGVETQSFGRGYGMLSSGRSLRKSIQPPRYEIDLVRPIRSIRRTSSGHFVLDDESFETECAYHDVNDIINNSDVHYPSRDHTQSADKGNTRLSSHQRSKFTCNECKNFLGETVTCLSPGLTSSQVQLRNQCENQTDSVNDTHQAGHPVKCAGDYVSPRCHRSNNPTLLPASRRAPYLTNQTTSFLSEMPSPSVQGRRVSQVKSPTLPHTGISTRDGIIMRPLLPRSSTCRHLDGTHLTSSPGDQSRSLFVIEDVSSVLPSSTEWASAMREASQLSSFKAGSINQSAAIGQSFGIRSRPQETSSDRSRLSAVISPVADVTAHDCTSSMSQQTTLSQQPYIARSPQNPVVSPRHWHDLLAHSSQANSPINNSNSSSGSENRMTYTRERLDRAVEKVRTGIQKVKSTRHEDEELSRIQCGDFYSRSRMHISSLDPSRNAGESPRSNTSSSGWSCVVGRQNLLCVPPGVNDSSSSGVCSKDTSHSFGSSMHSSKTEGGRSQNERALSALPCSPIARDDSHFCLNSHNMNYSNSTQEGSHVLSVNNCSRASTARSSVSHKREISGDENYEFDSVNVLESELLNALREYSMHPEADCWLLSSFNEPNQDLDITSSQHQSGSRREQHCSDADSRLHQLRAEYKAFRQAQERQSIRPSVRLSSEQT